MQRVLQLLKRRHYLSKFSRLYTADEDKLLIFYVVLSAMSVS